jgi:hypothetical protein
VLFSQPLGNRRLRCVANLGLLRFGRTASGSDQALNHRTPKAKGRWLTPVAAPEQHYKTAELTFLFLFDGLLLLNMMQR